MIKGEFHEVAHVHVVTIWRKIERKVFCLDGTQHTVDEAALAAAICAC
jgi:hypothetical protein